MSTRHMAHGGARDASRRTIHIRPRYFRCCTDPGVEEAERNYRYACLDWQVSLAESALVCVDVWNWCSASDTFERTDGITREKIAPLVQACRRHGLLVVHAPANPVAVKHPNWVRLLDDWQSPQPPFPGSPDWPPSDFKTKTGTYAQYARPHEHQEAERARHRLECRNFHPEVMPQGDEPVVVSGEELHRMCAQRNILHLFFAGFHTNACIVRRDYAPYAMLDRGYHCILVRDCTTGMETHETVSDLICTKGAIASFEQFGIYTATSDELTDALVTLE